MDDLFDYIDKLLAKNGFSRKYKTRNIWFKDISDAIIICSFQKSRHSNEGFLNFGIFFPKLSNITLSKALRMDNWHMRGRYEGIINDDSFLGLFPIEIKTKEDLDLMDYLERNLNEIIIPFLSKYSDTENLKKDLINDTFDFNKMLVAISVDDL